jgi:rfaE bifunctional protein nucleotidyltransferase chain/domain
MTKDKIISLKKALEIVRDIRHHYPALTIVTVNGTFDMFHPGHLELLERAKKFGEYLIVLMNSDRSVRLNKGKGRPIIDQKGRAMILASIGIVNAVVIFNEKEVHDVLRKINPDYHVKGITYIQERVDKEKKALKIGSVIYLKGSRSIYSTSNIIEKVKRLK